MTNTDRHIWNWLLKSILEKTKELSSIFSMVLKKKCLVHFNRSHAEPKKLFMEHTSDYCTEREIFQQPLLWKQVYKHIDGIKDQIYQFLEPIIAQQDVLIILTGAGSSAFIGNAVQGVIQKATERITMAIPSTDIITFPDHYLSLDRSILLVSFARSGNSPESLEVLQVAEKHCKKAHHLIITCNGQSELASANPKCLSLFKLILPETTNDQGLAMTGSFTAMLLSILLVMVQRTNAHSFSLLQNAINDGEKLLNQYSNLDKWLQNHRIERAVFLGSGPMLGVARECQLKLQELTNGKVICKYDSFLGFRHGPRVVINGFTLIVYLLSDDDHAFKYENDLLNSIYETGPKNPVIVFNARREHRAKTFFPFELMENKANPFHVLSATLIGQLVGFSMSLNFKLNPDNPSPEGIISRTVQGVTIYPRSTS